MKYLLSEDEYQTLLNSIDATSDLEAENKRLRVSLEKIARTRPELSQDKANYQLVTLIEQARAVMKEMNDEL